MAEQDKRNSCSGALTEPNLGNGTSLASVMHTGLGLESPFMREIFLKRQVIVGTRFQGGSDQLVENLKKGSRITFLREPENEYDPNAVMALDEQGRKLGYIPRRENELMGALMAAGKYFYGIITDPPETDDYYGRKTPLSIWMDLYMREFPGPDDLYEIPLQGYRGSYIVADFSFAPVEGTLRIIGFYAIKVIRGEERETLHKTLLNQEREPINIDQDEYEGMIKTFTLFAGNLPLVTFDIIGRKQECLEETCDMVLGKPFSNRMIDTLQMAENHLPEVNSDDLIDYADHLGISVHCDDPDEERCRIIWQLYSRMERSELENRKTMDRENTGQVIPFGLDGNSDILFSDLGLTERTRNILYKNNIDTVREIASLTKREVLSLEDMDQTAFKEIEHVLKNLKAGFRPDGKDAFLYGYPEKIKDLYRNKSDCWHYLFFMELIKVKYQWLKPLRNRHLVPRKSDIAEPVIGDVNALKDLVFRNVDIFTGIANEIEEVINDRLEIAFTEPDEPGTAQELVEVTDHLMGIYKRLIHWTEEFPRVNVIPEYSKAIISFAEVGESICTFFDELYESCVRSAESINDYLDGFITAEEVKTSLNLKIKLPDDPLKEIRIIFENELRRKEETMDV